MSWEKLPPIETPSMACLACGAPHTVFPTDARIAIGFGSATLEKDGAVMFSEDGREWDDCMSGEQAEEMAAADPDHDWRISLYGPLSGRVYQRHDAGEWVLVEQSRGFA